MDEHVEERSQTTPAARKLSSAHIGFDVVDRNGKPIGTVRNVNRGRTCLVVEDSGSLLRRKHSHPVHVSAVDNIDLDTYTIALSVTKAHVAEAPEFQELDADCEAAIARHYSSAG